MNTGTVENPAVKVLENVLHFVIEPQAQFYPTFYKSRATRQKAAIFQVRIRTNQKAHGDCKQ